MVVDPKLAKVASEILLNIKAVVINTKKPFRFTSGMLSPMYTDNRLLISYPTEWQQILTLYVKAIKKVIGLSNFDVLSGTATAAIPHAAALACVLNKPMVYVRASKKEHGKENQIEGTFKKSSRVLIIEDLISTGKSSGQNADAIRSAGGKVESCVAITTSTSPVAYENTFKEMKVKLFTITDAQTTVEVATQKKYITKEQKDSVDSFLANPPGWAKKIGLV